ncbi:helix-turn-helix transcriptional regulator [Brevundimonas sp. A19_0]|uniref:helix-turn-helix domain-containing protein n=1 Tax=Brevundimonas sp. A19_0 TaxID=2821087 RepID=UPI001ADB260D|nr:helix-turn-helix transcriptional regulator [Brevundimonas sp. A19_0]MBO9500782.1 helix-turn-helix transcriptional regulator [Brevundimonas sp. A19_0]
MMLATWRKSKGWTQTDLARAVRKSKPLISGLETGAIAATTDLAIAIDRLSCGEVPVHALRPDLHDVRVVRAAAAPEARP